MKIRIGDRVEEPRQKRAVIGQDIAVMQRDGVSLAARLGVADAAPDITPLSGLDRIETGVFSTIPVFAKALSLEDIRYESPELCPSTYPQMGVFCVVHRTPCLL